MVVGYQLKYGWKTAFASPENKPTFLHAHKLMRKIGDWMPTKEDINTNKWEEVCLVLVNQILLIEWWWATN
jgi:twinkle protein